MCFFISFWTRPKACFPCSALFYSRNLPDFQNSNPLLNYWDIIKSSLFGFFSPQEKLYIYSDRVYLAAWLHKIIAYIKYNETLNGAEILA